MICSAIEECGMVQKIWVEAKSSIVVYLQMEVEEDGEFWNKVMTEITIDELVYVINAKPLTSKVFLYLQKWDTGCIFIK